MYGAAAEVWLRDLPELRDKLHQRWSLIEVEQLSELSFNYLEFVKTSVGQDAVLKIGFPNPELTTEIRALEIYNGLGAVKIIDADHQMGAILLERIIPGDNLLSMADDHHQTEIAAQIMNGLWCPVPRENVFPTIKKWCQAFKRYHKIFLGDIGPLDRNIVQTADELATELLQENKEEFLLHGDFHHLNILQQGKSSWVAIDPKGVIGDRAFEMGSYLYNPIPDLLNNQDIESIIKSRIDILVNITGVDRKRIIAWSVVRAVLSSIWSIEDRTENPQYGIHFAKLILKLTS
jgi:streptomycin 6-kinase